MFLDEIKQHGKIRVQIRESYRKPGRRYPAHRVVRHVGTAAPGPELDAMRAAARAIIAELQATTAPAPVLGPSDALTATVIAHRQQAQPTPEVRVAVSAMSPRAQVAVGVAEVFGPLFDQVGLGTLFTSRHRAAAGHFRAAVRQRLRFPGRSKRGQWQRSCQHPPRRMSPDPTYRMMSQLTPARIAAMQRRVAAASQAGMPARATDVLFFDATTLRFTREQADTLRRKGYSKDGHPHRVQVVLTVILGQNGLPLGYEVFPGNTADVATLQPALVELRHRYGPTRMVVVADAGMLSTANLNALTAAGFEYIVAARLRMLPDAAMAEIGDAIHRAAAGPTGKRLLDTTVRGRRLVVQYDPVRARKQARERTAAVTRAERRIAAGQVNVRTDRFVTAAPHGRPRVDWARVEREARFDGLHGVFTSLTDTDAATVRARYHDLWLIERGFRVLKHDLAIRPVFHWTPQRVQAHIAICFAAFALLRLLWHRLRALRPGLGPFSEAFLLEELHGIHANVYMDTESGTRFMMPSVRSEFQKAVYEVCGRRLPRRGQLLPPSD